MLRGTVTLFWLLFLADGLFSVADEVFSHAAGSSPLIAVRGFLALSVLALSLVMVVIIGITPKAPKRILVPLILFAWWAGPAMAFPLGFWKVPYLEPVLAVGQVILALALWRLSRRRVDGQGKWLLPVNTAPAFSWKHLVAGIPLALALVLFAASSVLLGFSAQVESLTGGYVRVRPGGIYLIERTFQSGDREVRLAGMMHIARREFYAGLLPPGNPEVPSVVLLEGVTDRKRLLGGRTLDYGPLAKLLNVTSQTDSPFSERVATEIGKQGPAGESGGGRVSGSKSAGIYFKHADVDIETFHPQTIAFILTVTAIFQSQDLRELIGFLTDPSSPIADEDSQQQVFEDILVARNQRLVSEIETSLKDYRCVVVPWGAMHLPEIELWLRDHNFVQNGEIARKALAFW